MVKQPEKETDIFDLMTLAALYEAYAEREDASVRKLKTIREKHLARERAKVWREAAATVQSYLDAWTKQQQERMNGG